MNQGDLFNGLALGHAAAERAADHAGEAWKDRAYRAFIAFAASRKTFTTEEARESCGHVGDPPDRRAWGAIALRAKRDGKVKAIRHVKESPSAWECLHVMGNDMTAFKRGFRGKIRVHLNDEAPRIGSGVRIAEVKVGNRHAWLRNPITNRTAKILRSTLIGLKPEIVAQ
jgi:hypothetical protein